MLYADAFRRLMKSKLIVACMVVIVSCALLSVLTLIPGFVDDPKKAYEKPDEVTLLDRSYHPPTLLMALGNRDGIKDSVLTPEVEKHLDEAFSGGVFSANAWHLPLGADRDGRNVLSMILHGLRMAFLIGFVTMAISTFVAVVFGALAGYFGGFVDDVIVWIYTTLASIPFLLLLIAIMSIIDDKAKQKIPEGLEWLQISNGLYILLFVVGMTFWVGLARLIRAEFMKHKGREYVQACRALGYGHVRTIFRHIIPNVSHVVIISFTIGFVTAVNIEVFLTFVGVGVQPTDPTWGNMIAAAKHELTRDPSVWWPLTAATILLFILSLAFSIFGDALRDALDPKLRAG